LKSTGNLRATKRWIAFTKWTIGPSNASAPRPRDQLTFVDLYMLGRHSPALASQRWQKVIQAARSELHTGYRAGNIVANPSASLCWHKASFLVLRAELVEG
jgi:hypothetical protein